MLCECGCGQETAVAQMTSKAKGHIKGQPLRFLMGHSGGLPRTMPIMPVPERPQNVPVLCACGCGQETPLASATSRSKGLVKGQPARFVKGHSSARPWNTLSRNMTPEQVIERRRATKKRRYDANPEPLRAKSKRWRVANPEKTRELHYRWCLENPERSEVIAQTARARRRVRQNAVVERFSRQEVWDRSEGVCGICDEPADPQDWHVDHIVPLARGGSHTLANVQASHPACNQKKWAHLDHGGKIAVISINPARGSGAMPGNGMSAAA